MKAFLLTVVLFVGPAPAAAGPEGPGHYHGVQINRGQAVDTASWVLSQLVDRGKLDASWEGIRAVAAERKVFEKGEEWLVRFDNPAPADASKRTLYVFLTLDGKVLAANFTGR